MDIKKWAHSLVETEAEQKPESTEQASAAVSPVATPYKGVSSGVPSPYPQNPVIPSPYQASGAGLMTPPFVGSSVLGSLSKPQIDDSIVNELVAAVNGGKLPGHTKFHDIIDVMDGMSDAQRITTGLKILAKQGLSIQDVLASEDERLKILDDNALSYEQFWKQEVQNQVTNVQEQIADIERKAEQLRAELHKLDEQRATKMQESASAQVKLEQDRGVFHVTFDTVRTGVQRERDVLASYIPSVPLSPKK